MTQTKKISDYFELLREAFDFTIKYKILWFLGFVAALFPGGGIGNIINLIEEFSPEFQHAPVPRTTVYPDPGMSVPYSPSPAMNSMSDFIESPVFVDAIVFILLFVIVVTILFWYLSSICKVSLVKAVIYDAAGKSSKISIKKLWLESHDFLMRILWYGLILIGLSSPLFIGLIVIPMVTGIFGVVCLCCAWIPLTLVWAVVFGAMNTFGSRLIVIEDMGALEALSTSWKMFVKHFRKYILAFLVMMLPGIVAGVVFAIIGAVSSVLLLPCVAVMRLLIEQSLTSVAVLVGLLWTFGISVVIAALQSPWLVFVESYWTKFFLQVRSEE